MHLVLLYPLIFNYLYFYFSKYKCPKVHMLCTNGTNLYQLLKSKMPILNSKPLIYIIHLNYYIYLGGHFNPRYNHVTI